MKKRTKNAFLLILSVLTSLLVFCGCKLNKTRDEYLAEYGLTASVTYYTDKVPFESKAYVTRMDYKPGSTPMHIGVVSSANSNSVKFSSSNTDYRFDGWYYIELDVEGQPVFEDEDKKLYKLTDEAFDFSEKLQDGEHVIIGAKWSSAAVVRVVALCDEGETISGKMGDAEVSFKNGDEIVEVTFPSKEIITHGEINSALKAFEYSDEAFTLVDYYMDAEAKEKVSSIKKGDDDVIVYARYLTGKWTVVSTAKNVKNMFRNLGNEDKKYWIAEDIDCETDCKSVPYEIAKNMRCEIASDGKTISNLIFKGTGLKDTSSAAMFGKIGATAKISNVNFENVSMQCAAKNHTDGIFVYLVYTSIEAGASVQNVHISGSIELSNGWLASTKTNVAYGECGYDTDEAYETENPNGFKTTVTIME